jgi:hypothetical protein
MSGTLLRFIAYGMLGWAIEIVWTALHQLLAPASAVARGGHAPDAGPRGAAGEVEARAAGERWRLAGTTYLWMFPLYGSMVFLYEPLHDALRPVPWLGRALVYAAAFLAVEYVAGWLLRRLTGSCPWDYSRRQRPSRWQLHGLVRLDYLPAWALLGLALEPVHDFLLRLAPFALGVLRS